MIVRCTECNAAYAVDDEKVRDKKFGFTCPKCETNVIIDNRGEAGEHEHPQQSPEPAGFEFDEDAALSVEMGEAGLGEGVPDEGTASAPVSGDIGEDVLADMPELPEEEPLAEEPVVSGEAAESEDFFGDEVQMDVPDSIETEKEDTAEPAIEEGVEEDFDVSGDIMAEEPSADIPAEETAITVEPEAELSPSDVVVEDVSDEELQALQDIEGFDVEEPTGEEQEEEMGLQAEDEIKTDEVFSQEAEDIDESLTIDLDSLDIQLDEEEKAAVAAEEHQAPDETEGLDEFQFEEPPSEPSQGEPEAEEDLDLTLDLDSLDIPLDEIEEVQPGEEVEEDERLTLEDAGLTIDELVDSTAGEGQHKAGEEEEELRLSIDEIDPNLTIDNIHNELTDEESAQLLEDSNEIDLDELPEIDMDEFEKDLSDMEPLEDVGIPPQGGMKAGEDYLDLETGREISEYGETTMVSEESDMVPGGMSSFSIDYALSFSRVGGVLRLFGIYMLSLIPHMLVFLVYYVLASILGFINWLIILFAGYGIEDFMDIQKKTIRYLLYISSNATGVVEDRPRFTGSRDIDHSMQYDVVYPSRPSRILALLRITGVGIIITALPHLLLLMVLSLGLVVIALAGIISVIVTRRWPGLLFDFMVRYYRYSASVLSFVFGLVDRYPSFRF